MQQLVLAMSAENPTWGYRAESLNSKLKRKWANRSIPAVGVGRQTIRILGFGIALNWEAEHHRLKRLREDAPRDRGRNAA